MATGENRKMGRNGHSGGEDSESEWVSMWTMKQSMTKGNGQCKCEDAYWARLESLYDALQAHRSSHHERLDQAKVL